MTVPELFFLALGLSLGVAVGAVLLDRLRAGPPRPEIRVMVTHNALPPRPAPPRPSHAPVGVAVVGGRDPVFLAALGRGTQRQGPPLTPLPSAVAVLEPAAPRAPREPPAGADRARRGGSPAREASPPAPAAYAGDCAAERQLAEERCLVAVQARERAETAAQGLRDAQRAYDEAATRAERAQRESDPRAVAELKEAARRAFRSATEQATERRDLEAAATTWLTEINRINRTRREAAELAVAERQRADAVLIEIERLTVATDAARITAETATNACYEAREALAACEEAQLGILAADAVAVAELEGPPGDEREGGDDELLVGLRSAAHQPAIYRLLRGDRATLTRIVNAQAETPEERRRMQLLLSELVDAVVAGAIEQAVLDFPTDHPFWGDFTRAQCRDVAVALASLGYRFDGLGGFDGGRVPGTRDLSLAIGYAGLDPRRIRRWPNEAQAAELYREVSVAADEYLASAAANLSLGEMVALLGRRSEGLADLWNQWGRVRPLLLAATG